MSTTTTYTHPMGTTPPTTAAWPRYRVRGWLRQRLPSPLVAWLPKGAKDCGDHAWYRSDEGTDRCYYCEAGVREHVPVPLTVGSQEWDMLASAVAAGNAAAATIMRRRIDETRDAAKLAEAQARVLLH